MGFSLAEIVTEQSTMTISLGEILTIGGLFLTALGLIYAGIQIRLSRKVAKGEFLLHLDDTFQRHDEVYLRLRGLGWPDGRNGPQTVEEWVAVESYMSLFEQVQVLIKDGILDLETFDRLYGYRVFYIVGNYIIYQHKLIERKEQWKDFIALWESLNSRNRDRQMYPIANTKTV